MDEYFDDQPSQPPRYYDEGESHFKVMRKEEESRSVDENDRIDRTMDSHADWMSKNSTAQQILGDAQAIHVADLPEQQKAIEAASANAAANGIPVDPSLDPRFAAQTAPSPMLDPNNPASMIPSLDPFSNGAGSGTSAGSASDSGTSSSGVQSGAEKPTDLESTLSAIRMDTDRQKRFVILGDETIKRDFLAKLEERGQVYYSGGTAVITIGREKALATLREVSAASDGSVVHAVNLKLDREGGGPMVSPTSLKAVADNIGGAYDSLKAGFKNVIGRQHEINVVVVGNQATVDAKLEEVGKFVNELDKRKLLQSGPGTASNSADALTKSASGDNTVASADAKSASLKELSKNGPVELVGTSTLGSVIKVVRDKVSEYNDEKAAKQAELKEHDQAKKIKSMESDKAKESGGATVDKPETVKPFVRDLASKLTEGFQDTTVLAQEHGKGADKKTQAETLLQKVSGLKDPVEREFQALPEKDRHQALVHIAALVQKADSKEFGDKVHAALDSIGKEKTQTPREALTQLVDLEAKRTPDLMAKLTPLVQELVSSKTITEPQATAITEQFQKASEKVASSGAAETPAAAPGQAPVAAEAVPPNTSQTQAAPSASGPVSLRDTLEQVATAGPDKLSAAQAETLVSSLNALRGKSLAALDDSGGNQPTQTLVRLEGLVNVLGRGELGVRFEDPVPPAPPASNTADQGSAPPTGGSSLAQAVAQAQTKEPIQSPTVEPAAATPAKDASAPDAVGKVAPDASQPVTPAATAATPAPAATSVTSEAPLGQSLGNTPGRDPATDGSASRPVALRDSLEQMAAAGPDKLSTSQAESLIASLDAIRTKPLATLDGSDGNKPTQTLVRVEGLLKEMESGRLGDELKAQAKDLEAPLQKWAQQDAQRYARTEGDTVGSRDAVVAQAKAAEPAWHSQSTTADTKPELGSGAPGSEKATGLDTAAQSAKELAAQRLWETESAGGKLSMMMSNPPGSFTNRDKSWNEGNIQKAAQEVLKLDPEAAGSLSQSQVTKLAAYSYWMADNASSGKLPGFDTPQGKALAGQLVERAGALLEVMEAKGPLAEWPKDVAKDLKKADNMVESREKLDQMAAGSSRSQSEATPGASSSTNSRSISPQAASALANEMIHSVYRAPELSETQAKYLLKNASNLTPDSIKSMDPQTQAKTAVALSELTSQVRNGAMGDVDQLPGAVQKQLSQAEGAADKLLKELNKSPSMSKALQGARSELGEKLDSSSGLNTEGGTGKETARNLPKDKAGGHGLTR